MLKKTIKYTDFDGVEQTEDLYFNLTKAELMEMELVEHANVDELGESSALAKKLQAIIDSKSGKLIISTFKEIVAGAYGERSADGKRFMKSPEITKNFEATAAYSELFMELVTDANAASSFIRGLVPADLASDVSAAAPIMDSADIPRETQARLARQASEANLQGHRKKADHEGSDIQDVPSLPTVPVDPKFPTVPLVKKDPPKPIDEMSREELIAFYQN